MSIEPILFTPLNFDISFLAKNVFVLGFIREFYILLLNFSAYAFILLKLFKVLCYSSLTFDWLPMINPYIWPFSFFRIATGWYFELFQKHFPTIVINKRGFNISTIVGLELLNSLTFCLVRISHSLIYVLEDLEKVLK
jgi:hypothetical protein